MNKLLQYYGAGQETVPTQTPDPVSDQVRYYDEAQGPTLAQLNMCLADTNSAGAGLIAIEPWSQEVSKRGFVRVLCGGQPESLTAQYHAFFQQNPPEDTNNYNNCVLVAKGKIFTLRWQDC